MKALWLTLASVLVGLLLVPTAAAHAPLEEGGNESLETATRISDPAKSWAIYAELHEPGEAQYYRLDMAPGGRIFAMLFASPAPQDRGFLPTLLLMGPGLPDVGSAPAYVEVPEGAGVQAYAGQWPERATYEPFAPSAFYDLADVDVPAPERGAYYLAVASGDRGGRYGLAIGYVESFTPAEWLLTPFALLSVYEWAGQPLALVLAPFVATVAAGVGLLAGVHGRRPFARWRGPATIAGLLFLGSGATVGAQMVSALLAAPAGGEVIVTLIFVAAPVLLGVAALRIAFRREETPEIRTRAHLALVGALGLLAWSGFLAGPALAFAAALWPRGAPAAEAREAQA